MVTHALKSGISVLVCTHNGARNLPATLRHLAAQRVDGALPWEIIVVNNASTDDTAAVAGRLLSELPGAVPFRLVEEPRQGKDRAVDKGLALAQYQYVLICDDDNWLAEDYVQRAYEIVTANPRIGMLGGRSIPVFECNPPTWFKEVEKFYAVGEQNAHPGEVTTSKGFLWGAGAIINLAAYQLLLGAGFERIITFADYPDIARGEDVELCLAIKLSGYKIWYDPGLALQHCISKEKLSWAYIVRLAGEGGRMTTITGVYKSALRQNKLPGGKQLWLRKLVRQVLDPQFPRLWWNVRTKNREGSPEYLRKVEAWGKMQGYFTYRNRLDSSVRRIARLKAALPSVDSR